MARKAPYNRQKPSISGSGRFLVLRSALKTIESNLLVIITYLSSQSDVCYGGPDQQEGYAHNPLWTVQFDSPHQVVELHTLDRQTFGNHSALCSPELVC